MMGWEKGGRGKWARGKWRGKERKGLGLSVLQLHERRMAYSIR